MLYGLRIYTYRKLHKIIKMIHWQLPIVNLVSDITSCWQLGHFMWTGSRPSFIGSMLIKARLYAPICICPGWCMTGCVP